jgi:hypothetical protein
MKKILSLVLVLSLVLGSMSMAFAAAPSFSDVEDEAVLKAVKRLNAFGIVDGYDDGSYKPGKDITRAEFAKLLVTALGLQNAADAATGVSQFTDVAGNEWYAGSVSVAAGQGLVKGYADGTYRPDSEVKYSEAITMLVRALGYKDEFLPGTWPGNYIAKAASLDVTDDVKFQPNGFADRGSVAVLVNNTLDANIIEQESYGDNDDWAENKHKTLLTEKLTFDKFEAIELVGTPKVEKNLDDDQVKFDETDDSKMNDYDSDESGFDLPSNLDVKDADMMNALETRLGESLNVYVDDDEIVYFETADNASTVVWGTILDGDFDSEAKEITITFVDGDDKTYDYDKKDTVLYIDNEDKNIDKDEDDVTAGLFGKFVIGENGDIALADLNDWDDEALVVTEAKAGEFDYIKSPDSEKTFEADDYDKVVVMDTTGKIMNMEDLAKDTVVYINEADIAESGDEAAYVVAVETPAVTETAEDFDLEDADGEKEFTTKESDSYDINEYGTVSADEDDDIVAFAKGRDELESMTGKDAEVKILFDIVKDIRHITTDVDVSSTDLYGVILGTDDDNFDNDEIQIKILNSSEEKVVYDVDFDADDFHNITNKTLYGTDRPLDSKTGEVADLEERDLKDLMEGLIVKYTLNSDSEIDSMVVINHDKDNKQNDTSDELSQDDKLEANTVNNSERSDVMISSGKLKEDIEKDSIEFSTASNANFESGTSSIEDFTVDSNVVVFDVTDAAAGDMEVISFDSLIDNGSGQQILVVANEDEEAELIIVTNAVASETEYVGYILESIQKDDTHYFKMAVFGEEGTKKYEVDTASVDVDDISEQSMVVFKKKSDDTIEIKAMSDVEGKKSGKTYKSDDFKFVIGQITDNSSDWLKIDTNADRTYDDKVKLYNDTFVYQKDKDNKDVDQYDFVLVAKDGTKARIVQRYDIDYKDYSPTSKQEKAFEKAIYGLNKISSSKVRSGFYFGDGEAPSGGESNSEGKVVIDTTNKVIAVGGEAYIYGATSVLKNEKGTVIAVGITNIEAALTNNDEVKDVVVSDNNVIRSFVGTKVAKEIAAANLVIAKINNFTKPNATRVEVANARSDYDSLTASRKDLVTNYATLTAEESKLGSVETQKVADAKSALTISGDLDNVTTNLTLATSGTGVTIAWVSSDTSAIKDSTGGTLGTVTRPTYTAGDKNVTLTATITSSEDTDVKDTKVFDVTVKAADMTDAEAVALAKKELTIDGDLNNVTANLTLKTSGAHGTTITWASSNTTAIKDSTGGTLGAVTRPNGADQRVTLTATITKNSSNVTKAFDVVVKGQ